MLLEELKVELTHLNYDIRKVLKNTEYLEWKELSIEGKNEEERLLVSEYQKILSYLDYINSSLVYLNKSIKHVGKLHMNQNGRYFVNGIELTCGDVVEVLAPDWKGDLEWSIDRLEASQGKYYLVNHSKMDLEGAEVRLR